VQKGKEAGFFRVQHKRCATFKAGICNYLFDMGEYGPGGNNTWVVLKPAAVAAKAKAAKGGAVASKKGKGKAK
jgi:hypothetical protein